MAKIRYRRHHPHDPETVEVYGRTFEEGKAVEVDDATLASARGNKHFQVEGEASHGDEPVHEFGGSMEEDEARDRAKVAKAGAEETRRAKQAEARGGSSREDRA